VSLHRSLSLISPFMICFFATSIDKNIVPFPFGVSKILINILEKERKESREQIWWRTRTDMVVPLILLPHIAGGIFTYHGSRRRRL